MEWAPPEGRAGGGARRPLSVGGEHCGPGTVRRFGPEEPVSFLLTALGRAEARRAHSVHRGTHALIRSFSFLSRFFTPLVS